MIEQMACVCGGAGEFALLAALASGITWIVRKLLRGKGKVPR